MNKNHFQLVVYITLAFVGMGVIAGLIKVYQLNKDNQNLKFEISQRHQQEQITALDLQAKCADQSRIFFNDRRKLCDPSGKDVSCIFSSYTSHYSMSLKRCYIRVRGSRVDEIFDAFDGTRVFGCVFYPTLGDLSADDCLSENGSDTAAMDQSDFDNAETHYMKN